MEHTSEDSLTWAADFILEHEITPTIWDAALAGYDVTDPTVRKACGLPIRSVGDMTFPYDVSDLVG